MVAETLFRTGATDNFQYSLCRVVLMVPARGEAKALHETLSVLALSSRFDGPACRHRG